jgi:tetratricopeptide (TPR) repeat protein
LGQAALGAFGAAAALAALAALAPPAAAQYASRTSARSAAMGGVTVALGDDGLAVFNNPGALAGIDQQHIGFTFGELYGTDLTDNLLAYQLPVTYRHALGFGWQHGGLDDAELAYDSNYFGLGYGFLARKGLGLGITASYLREGVDLDGGTVSEWAGWTADLGGRYVPNPKLSLGLTLRNLFNLDVRHESGRRERLAENTESWILGASYLPIPELTLAADIDDRFHLGAEYVFRGIVAAQAGLQQQLTEIYGESSDGTTFSLGASVHYKGLRFDVAHLLPPVLPSTTRFTLGAEFTLSPSKVAIAKTELEPVFASQVLSYADRPVGTTKLVSKNDEPLSARLALYVPGFMEGPTEREIVLRPKETKEVDLNALFSSQLMALSEDRPAQAEVRVSYETKSRTRTERARSQIFLYRPGAISWADLRAAAAFVTVQDPAVATFARSVAQGTDEAGTGASLRNFYMAMRVFDTLGEYGITYVPDPNNPFNRVSETREAVDQVQYPRQLLSSRTGDCDDTSVLYCAMLENVGVPTAFLDGPGHILMLFDSGLHARNHQVLAVDESYYVVRGERVWIPVETTYLGRPFTEAWAEGAAIWARWRDNPDARFVEVQEAWQLYQPALPVGEAPSFDPPAAERVALRVAADMDTLKAWQQSYLEEKYLKPLEEAEKSRTGALDPLDQGLRLAHEGRLVEARAAFAAALSARPEDAAALNNLANVELAEGRSLEAVDGYRRAWAREPDAGILLNQGLALWTLGDEAGADTVLSLGIVEAGGLEEAFHLLGLRSRTSAEDGGRGRPPLLTEEEIRERLADAARRVPRPKSAERGLADTEDAQKPVASKASASRAADPQSLARYVYWKLSPEPGGS